jgi:hypothetical protein
MSNIRVFQDFDQLHFGQISQVDVINGSTIVHHAQFSSKNDIQFLNLGFRLRF